MCDGVSAGDRARWCVSELGLTAQQARDRVVSEYATNFGKAIPLQERGVVVSDLTWIPLPPADGDLLIWHDEFDYTGPPDPSKWSFELGDSGWGNGELQFYTDSPKNAYVSDGCLRIRALLEKCGSRDFTSARLTTLGKNDWQHGRFEARVRLPCGRGTWAGIWMMPTAGEPWPTGGEIDIVEHVGHDAGRIHGTVHTALCNHQQASQVGGILPLSVDQWHTYGIEWNAERIDFHCDGFRYFRICKDGGASKEGWPFDTPFHLIMNLAVGGNWGGQQGIDRTAFEGDGQVMEIAWIRAYRLQHGPPEEM